MKAVIYQYDEAPITLEDVESFEIEGDDITIKNFEGRTDVNIEDVQEVRLVSK